MRHYLLDQLNKLNELESILLGFPAVLPELGLQVGKLFLGKETHNFVDRELVKDLTATRINADIVRHLIVVFRL